MPKWRKKPVVVEAIQWSGNKTVMADWCVKENTNRRVQFNEDKTLTIETLEGNHIANLNDYIIKGVKGEIYPCKPDIFEMTYEKVED